MVVGGHSSGVDETPVVGHILRTRPTCEPWVAVKVSARRYSRGMTRAVSKARDLAGSLAAAKVAHAFGR